MSGKIFGIGMPKTGTCSLNVALNNLGIKSIHDPNELRQKFWETGSCKFNKNFEALINFGEWFFPQLDEAYPNSKFILTVRDKKSWLSSCKNHFSPMNDKKYKNLYNANLKKMEIFGIKTFNKKRFSYVYDLHEKTVKDYFKGRENDLLIIDICGGDKWNELCDFLGIVAPQGLPFPHKNRKSKRRRKHKKHAE